jgi:hypothetical protein
MLQKFVAAAAAAKIIMYAFVIVIVSGVRPHSWLLSSLARTLMLVAAAVLSFIDVHLAALFGVATLLLYVHDVRRRLAVTSPAPKKKQPAAVREKPAVGGAKKQEDRGVQPKQVGDNEIAYLVDTLGSDHHVASAQTNAV